MSAYDERYLEILRENVANAQQKLYEALSSLCPGPHLPRQHRDGSPPWCTRCGRDNLGVLRKDRRALQTGRPDQAPQKEKP